MPIDLDKFKAAYSKWVEESRPDFEAGKVQEAIKKYPLEVAGLAVAMCEEWVKGYPFISCN